MASYTNANRLTGLASGIDTDSYVKQLMYAASTRYYTYQRNLQKAQWQQDAYRQVATKIKDFQSKWLDITSSSSIRMQRTFTSKYTSSVTSSADGSESKSISVSGIKKAGAHTIEVVNTATAAKLTSSSSVSGKVDLTKDSTGFTFSYDGKNVDIAVGTEGSNTPLTADQVKEAINTALADKGITNVNVNVDDNGNVEFSSSIAGHNMSVKPSTSKQAASEMYTVKYDGTQKKFEVEEKDGKYVAYYGKESYEASTKEDALNKALGAAFKETKDADGRETGVQAVTASFDADGNIKLTTPDSKKYVVDTTEHTVASGVTNKTDYTIKYDEKEDDADADAFSFKLKENEAAEGEEKTYNLKIGDQEYTSLSKEDAEGKINAALKEKYGDVSKQDLDGSKTDVQAVTATIGDDGYVQFKAEASSERVEKDEVHSSSVSKTDITRDVSTSNFEAVKSGSKVSTSDSISSVIGDFKGTKTVNINGKDITVYSDTKISDFINAVNNSGAGVKMAYNNISGAFTIETTSTGSESKINFGGDAGEVFKALGFDTSKPVQGSDAIIKIDGVETISSTNKLEFEEFTADVTYAAVGKEFTVRTEKDTEAIYNLAADFVKDYNELITSIRDMSKENRSQGTKGYYEPLTDDEKKEMKDEEIEKWEKEAKKGILHSDSILNGFLSDVRQAFYSTTAKNKDGNSVGIYNLGITTTSNYLKGGLLEIDENKLKDAISNDPDAIMNIFNQIGDSLEKVAKNYVGTNGKISNKAGIEGSVTENSNTLYRQINDIKEKMANELKRLQKKEERYFEMFANMESSISKNNTTLDSIYSFMGY